MRQINWQLDSIIGEHKVKDIIERVIIKIRWTDKFTKKYWF